MIDPLVHWAKGMKQWPAGCTPSQSLDSWCFLSLTNTYIVSEDMLRKCNHLPIFVPFHMCIYTWFKYRIDAKLTCYSFMALFQAISLFWWVMSWVISPLPDGLLVPYGPCLKVQVFWQYVSMWQIHLSSSLSTSKTKELDLYFPIFSSRLSGFCRHFCRRTTQNPWRLPSIFLGPAPASWPWRASSMGARSDAPGTSIVARGWWMVGEWDFNKAIKH